VYWLEITAKDRVGNETLVITEQGKTDANKVKFTVDRKPSTLVVKKSDDDAAGYAITNYNAGVSNPVFNLNGTVRDGDPVFRVMI